MTDGKLGLSPLCLTVPGLGNSGPGHWQTIWEAERHDCLRVELGVWDDPIRNVWISRIDQAVGAAQGPVVLVGHSLGCLAIVWWAGLLGENACGNVAGALLVAPPDVDRLGADSRVARFAPTPVSIVPFPTIVVASCDDRWCDIMRAEELSASWAQNSSNLIGLGTSTPIPGLGRGARDRRYSNVCSMFGNPARQRPAGAASCPTRIPTRVSRNVDRLCIAG